MQDDVGSSQLDEADSHHCIEFTVPTPEPPHGGFNPYAAGYQKAAGQRRIALVALCTIAALVSGSLAIHARLATWPAALGIGFSICVAAASEWAWRRSRFCPLCGARTKGPCSASLVWCRACYNLIDSARIVVNPVGRFDVTGPDYLCHADPIPEFVCCVTLLAVKDGAREIRFEPEQDAYEVRIMVQDGVYELVPPPRFLHFPVAQTIKAIAGLDLATCDQQQEGRIDVIDGHERIATNVIVEPTSFGQKVTLRFVRRYAQG